MDSYLNTTLRASESTMPEFHLLSGAAMPQAGWRIADQGARIAGVGDCSVTASKFSTRTFSTRKFSNHMGPPLCSPPV
jgi:hypothetical protein